MTRFILAAAIAAAISTPVAFAQESRTRTIEYAPSMLLHDDSLALIRSRVEHAVRSVCNYDGIRGLQDAQLERDCETKTGANALAELNFRVAEARSNRGTVTIVRAGAPVEVPAAPAAITVQAF